MNKALRHGLPLLLAVISAVLHTSVARADGIVAEPATADDSGFTVLSNATNVTHWGLGVGVGYRQTPYRGDDTKYTPIPLIYFDDKWVHALGTTLDLKLGKWDGVAFTLRAQYALGDGYRQSNSPSLSGMQDRNGAFWYGPAFTWTTEFGTLSGDFLTSGNKGQKAGLDFGKTFAYGQFSIKPHVGTEWLSDKYVDYYYGVRPSEVQAGRNEYQGSSTYDVSLGLDFAYRITPQQMVTFSLGASHLGSGITDSPLVDKKFIPQARLGYLYQFN